MYFTVLLWENNFSIIKKLSPFKKPSENLTAAFFCVPFNYGLENNQKILYHQFSFLRDEFFNEFNC